MKGKITKTRECRTGVVYVRYKMQIPRKLLDEAGLSAGGVEISASRGRITIDDAKG